MDPAFGAAPFDEIIRSTPQPLKDAGLYTPIAVPWHPAPFRSVSIQLLAVTMGASLKAVSLKHIKTQLEFGLSVMDT